MSQSYDRTGARRPNRLVRSSSGRSSRAPVVLKWAGRIAVAATAAVSGALFAGAGLPSTSAFFPAFAGTPRPSGPLLPYEIAVDGVPLPRVAARWELREYPAAQPSISKEVRKEARVASLSRAPVLPIDQPEPPGQRPIDIEFAWIAAETPQVLTLGWTAAAVPTGIAPQQAHALTLLRQGDVSGFQVVWPADTRATEAEPPPMPSAGTPPGWLTVSPLPSRLQPAAGPDTAALAVPRKGEEPAAGAVPYASPGAGSEAATTGDTVEADADTGAPRIETRDTAVPLAGEEPAADAAPDGSSDARSDVATAGNPVEAEADTGAPRVETRGTAVPRRRPVVRRSVVRPFSRRRPSVAAYRPPVAKPVVVRPAKPAVPKAVPKIAAKPAPKPVAKPAPKVSKPKLAAPKVAKARKPKPAQSSTVSAAPNGPKWSY